MEPTHPQRANGLQSHEPTSPAKPLTQGRGDTPPPAPPHEAASSDAVREFELDGTRWLAYPSGTGAFGTGSYGLGLLQAIHFADPADPDRPLREALIPCGRFGELFDAELSQILAGARLIPPPPG